MAKNVFNPDLRFLEFVSNHCGDVGLYEKIIADKSQGRVFSNGRGLVSPQHAVNVLKSPEIKKQPEACSTLYRSLEDMFGKDYRSSLKFKSR